MNRYPTASSAHGNEGSFEARIAIEKSLHGIVVGMRAKVELVCETLDDVLMLPTSAVFHEGEEAYCWVASATGEPVKVALSLGPKDGESIIVYGELSETTKVLVEEPKK